MNILMALSQTQLTGAEVYAVNLGDELVRRGHNLFYISDTMTKAHQGEYFKLRFNKRSIPRRFWHIARLIYIIKKHKIQIVHAHSRASSWSCHIACKLTGTPMVTSVHGRQPEHTSRKKFHAMGDLALPVSEAIEQQLINNLGVPASKIKISRNGINTNEYKPGQQITNQKTVISIIGRLSGPKGELCYKLLSECIDLDKYQVQVASGNELPVRFERFKDKVKFLGYIKDIPSLINSSDLVIGAGRVAMETILMHKPIFAVGEASCHGLITTDNLEKAMATNFGDIGPKDLDIEFSIIPQLIEDALSLTIDYKELSQQVTQHYELDSIADEIENTYQSVHVRKTRKEMPFIMYHRFIKDDSEKGVHGTYMRVDMLEKHLKLIKRMGYETITFKDLAEKGFIHRLTPGKKFIMITVDDGYLDNYELLLPLLQKHNMKAVIYIVTGENHNRWDVEDPKNPEKHVRLMDSQQLKLLIESGHVELGGHTMTHPKLDQLSTEQQWHEIMENKRQLEEITGSPLLSFAYPYGIFNDKSIELVKQAGYQFAVATNSGPLAAHEEPFIIRRIGIFPRTNVFGLWRKIKGDYLFRKVKNC